MLPDQNQPNWTDYWNAFLNGRTDALEVLHQAFYPDLYRYALKIRQDKELAEDAIQELFAKLWTKRDSLPEVHHVKAYLIKALRSILLNELRGLDLRSMKITLEHYPGMTYSAEDILLKAEERQLRAEKIAAVLNSLSDRQREVIYLRYYEELDFEAIASILGVNYQSALNLSQRALKAIRKKILPGSE